MERVTQRVPCDTFQVVQFDDAGLRCPQEPLGHECTRFVIAVGGNFVLGALMTLGIGLYAPCLIMLSLMGLDPRAAFPIMMGSCAFLMPVGGLRFVRRRRYNAPAALGLAIGGPPAVLIAGYLVKQMPLVWLRWLVVCVVLYAAALMLGSALAPASGMGD